MPRAKHEPSMGKALRNSCAMKHAKCSASRVGRHTTDLGKHEDGPASTLEQSNLDEFITSANLARQKYTTERHVKVSETVVLRKDSLSSFSEDNERENDAALAARVFRRPPWNESMSPDDVREAEDLAFLDWRRELARIEEKPGVVLSPFEKNVDFWRQLWRTLERSDVVVQIVDARDPLFFLSTDLFKYVEEVGESQGRKKRCVLLVNKADFVPTHLRESWRRYFNTYHDGSFEVFYFSALRESVPTTESDLAVLTDTVVLGEHASGSDVISATELMDKLQSGDDKVVVGMVGFPNVGKSSVINALVGCKKVSASATPGKTKHIQTIRLTDDVTLCDCPGIVLPSLVASKSHLVVNGTMPLDHLRGGFLSASELVVERMGMNALLDHYKCRNALLPQFMKLESDARAFLSAMAVSKKLFLALNVPDESKAARLLLKDFCSGKVVHVMLPPGDETGADRDLLINDEEEFVHVDETDDYVLHTPDSSDGMNDAELDLDIAMFLAQRESVLAPVVEDAGTSGLTKRAVRMADKKVNKNKNRFNGTSAANALRTELNLKIASMKPGGGGRRRKALEDPYGCHPVDEF